MKAVTPRDDLAPQLAFPAVVRIAHSGHLVLEPVHGNVAALKVKRRAGGNPRRHEILYDLCLAVDRHRSAVGQLTHRDVVAGTTEAKIDAAVHQPLTIHALPDAGLPQNLGGPLLKHAGANSCLDVVAATCFQHHRLHTVTM